MEDELENTIYDLLRSDYEVGDIVEAIEQRKVRMIDRFGRDNQLPKGKDLDDLLNQLERHVHMIWNRGVPSEHSIYDTDRYWQNDWPSMNGYMPGVAPPILRAWLVGEQELSKSNSKTSESGSKTGAELADKRWAKHKVLCEEVREMAIPFINRGKLLHNVIANELIKTSDLGGLSRAVVIREVAGQCYEMHRDDLIRGKKKPK